MDIVVYFHALPVMFAMGFAAWLLSVYLRDVSIVDSLWPLMLFGGALVFFGDAVESSGRSLLIVVLVGLWALRLFTHLTWRNWGEPEDRRYQAIRAKYDPNFAIKSLFIIFGFQAVVAWVIAMPLWPAITVKQAFSPLDALALAVWTAGMLFETVGDWQLARFKANPDNRGKVMDRGLWRYTRHPNYFGECLIWWGFYLFALSSGAWWSIVAPLLMTWLLLKFSGVTMLEETIVERRPAYREYIGRTNAFLPGRPKPAASHSKGVST